MKIPPRQVKNFLENPTDKYVAALFHGNDSGLISDRAKQFASLFNENLDDVFSVTRINGDMLSNETGLIADSAAAIPAFGNKRLVLVKGLGTELLAACKLALNNPIAESIIIVEAHETNTKHAIVKLFETNRNTASIGCYADGIDAIRSFAAKIFADENISICDKALNLIAYKLVGDRGISKQEIEKLVLMAGPGGELKFEDIQVVLSDSASLAMDAVADALASGSVTKLQQSLQKAWTEDANAIMLVRSCQGYFQQLYLAGYTIDKGQSVQDAVQRLRPPPHFKLRDRLQSHLKKWRPQHAMNIVERLQDIELKLKISNINSRTYTAQSLLGICLRAPR